VNIHIFTIFPEMFTGPLEFSILKRAAAQGLATITVHNIRDFTHDRHHTVDDAPYGGGAGMVFKPEPVFEAVESLMTPLAQENGERKIPVILLSPQGRLLTQDIALELSREATLIFICGHYEGVDERIAVDLANDNISIGDYVLSGGELPAMVLADAVVRLIPGVLGSPESPIDESHSTGLLEYPQYTRPPDFRGKAVPDVLLSGNHAEIAKWRRKQAIIRTFQRRPDMLAQADLSEKEKDFVRQLQQSEEMV
jgi:tRNA (guanine37-N1)-methyltransferase